MYNQTRSKPKSYQFLCTDMHVFLPGPRGEKGDDGEPGLPAKSVERIKFECKASPFLVMYGTFDRIAKYFKLMSV